MLCLYNYCVLFKTGHRNDVEAKSSAALQIAFSSDKNRIWMNLCHFCDFLSYLFVKMPQGLLRCVNS